MWHISQIGYVGFADSMTQYLLKVFEFQERKNPCDMISIFMNQKMFSHVSYVFILSEKNLSIVKAVDAQWRRHFLINSTKLDTYSKFNKNSTRAQY